jgi:hypothetical protein
VVVSFYRYWRLCVSAGYFFMIDLKPLAAPPSPREASWLGPFRHELMAFPNGRNDDQVDSVAQFLDWMSLRV